MTLTITLDELLAWTAEERAKWLPWLKANPKALDVTVQPGGRFPTVASLIDHLRGEQEEANRELAPLVEQPHLRALGESLGELVADARGVAA